MSRCPTSFALFLGVFGLVVGVLGASAGAKDQTTILEIVGDDGVARIVLSGKGRDGQPQIALYDEKHVQRASIGFARGGPEISLSDSSGKELVVVGVFERNEETVPFIETISPSGNSASMGANATDAWVESAYGGVKQGRAVLRAIKDGAAVELGTRGNNLGGSDGGPDTFASMSWARERGGEVEVRTTEGRVADRLPARGERRETPPVPERK